MRVGLYVRVSTIEQERHGHSIEVQKEKLRAFAKAKDYVVVKEYVDAAQSGAKLERPALKRLIIDIENKELEGVLVYRLDRLSRSQKDTMYLIEDIFLKNDVAFVSLQESFDTTTSFGRAMIGMLSVFAQLERDNIKERLFSGRAHRAKTGFYHGGGIIPFGYRYDTEEGVLKRFKNEADELERMFELVAAGKSITSVAKELSMRDTTVKRRIANPLYIGKVQFDNEVFEGKHEPIIDEELFRLANAKMNSRAAKTPFKRTYLLTGLIYCGLCGGRCSAYESRSKHNGKEYRKAYYRCNARTWKHKQKYGEICQAPNIQAEKLEKAVLEQVKRLPLKRKTKRRKIDFKAIEDKINSIDKQKDRLVDLYISEHLDKKTFNKKLLNLEETQKKLIDQLEEMRNYVFDETNNREWLMTIEWESLDKETLREILDRVITRIVVHGNDIEIHFK